jgi:hypothetical protein
MTRMLLLGLLALAAKARAHEDPPTLMRVMVQVIEVPHSALTKWTGAEKLKGSELHERAVKLAETGEGEIVETSVLVVRSGEKAVMASIAERIYPTEYEPPELPSTIGAPNDKTFKLPTYTQAQRPVFSFETRDAGASLEVEPLIDDGGLFYLGLRFEMVDLVALTTWMEFADELGDASIRMPDFESRRWTGAVTVAPGVFELCTVFTPKPAAVPAAATRQLLFVRCDALAMSN